MGAFKEISIIMEERGCDQAAATDEFLRLREQAATFVSPRTGQRVVLLGRTDAGVTVRDAERGTVMLLSADDFAEAFTRSTDYHSTFCSIYAGIDCDCNRQESAR